MVEDKIEQMSNRPKKTALRDRPITSKNQATKVPPEVLRAIESEIEQRFIKRALDLTTNERWSHYWNALKAIPLRTQRQKRTRELLIFVEEFGHEYAKLLEWVVQEFARRLIEIAMMSIKLRAIIGPDEIRAISFQFVKRFTKGQYKRPWGTYFILPIDPKEKLDHDLVRFDFQKPYALDYIFKEAEWLAGLRKVARLFFREIYSSGWKRRAMNGLQGQVQLLAAADQHTDRKRSTEFPEGPANLPSIQEFRSLIFITQGKAAEYLRCTSRTIRSYIRKGQLNKNKAGKIFCDDKWTRELRNRFGPTVRLK